MRARLFPVVPDFHVPLVHHFLLVVGVVVRPSSPSPPWQTQVGAVGRHSRREKVRWWLGAIGSCAWRWLLSFAEKTPRAVPRAWFVLCLLFCLGLLANAENSADDIKMPDDDNPKKWWTSTATNLKTCCSGMSMSAPRTQPDKPQPTLPKRKSNPLENKRKPCAREKNNAGDGPAIAGSRHPRHPRHRGTAAKCPLQAPPSSPLPCAVSALVLRLSLFGLP
ncbi:hypothetical protein B0J18DRAFT_163945 [Chaetomium sp. MPI-SDFR-AT-0129]|nr:hypothetical protein B0J18DRAFT_163945 [Chaetomium sp. MPI-SDFR-AT-0129]